MKRSLFCLLLLGCSALNSQSPCPTQPHQIQPLQVKVCAVGPAGYGSLPCSFDNPFTLGDLLVVAGVGSCGGGTCATVFDNLGNRLSLALAVPQYNGIALSYETGLAGVSGVTFEPSTNWWNIIAEYPPSTGLDDAAWGSYTDAGLTLQGVEIQDNVGWAGVHRTGQAALSPVETHESCELLISWALVGQGTPVAGPYFTMRADNPFVIIPGSLALEDSTSTAPGYQPIASISWTYPNAWDEGVAAFKMMGGCK